MKASLLAIALLPACGSPKVVPLPDLTPDEIALRTQLGIPLDAEHVIVFGQNAHLDIDWQHTFDDYYSMFVESVFLQARQILDAQPRAFYSIAEMAYLQHHLAVHPEELAAWQADAARGALHVVGGGMTSPDTLLPETEMLARDYLYGIQFAEDTLGAHPTAAWLPDSFGHGAAAPDLLAAAGYTSAAFARIDGAPGLFDEIHMPGIGPRADSTAAQLLAAGSADFLWQGSGGATILGHFLAGTGLYCQGDNLDYNEPLETAGGHIGAFKGMDTTFTDGSIDRYISELTPYAKTRYMFVPVGCDFASPKEELLGYLDGYDSRRYGDTHVYAVAAPFDDYAAFVQFHTDGLPTISAELSPYYMGFYGTRADVKRQTRDAARPFFEAETFATLLGDAGRTIALAVAPSLSLLARTDHHDFVTGTSSDDVVANEQLPLLATATATGTAELAQVAAAIAAQIPMTAGATSRVLALNASSAAQTGVAELDVPTTGGAVPLVHALANGVELPLESIDASDTVARFRVALTLPPFGWQAIDVVPGAPAAPIAAVALAMLDATGQPSTGDAVVRVVVSNAAVRAQWDRSNGTFALTSLVEGTTELLAGPSLIVHDYQDEGGLWRLGNEMTNCALTAIVATPGVDAIQILEQGALGVRVAFVSADVTREVALAAGDTALDVVVTTGAAKGTTRTVGLALAPGDLATSVPGGTAIRTAAREYTPTFWAATSWARIGGAAVLLRQSTGARMDPSGALELMAARDAREEACDVEGGVGSDPGTHRIEWRIAQVGADSVERVAQAFDRPLALVAVPAAGGAGIPASGALLDAITGPGIVSALKPAERGTGVILRVVGKVDVEASARVFGGGAATLVDLAERDRGPATVSGSTISFDPARDGNIASARLQP